MVTDLLHDFPLHLFFFFPNYKTSRAYVIKCSAPFSLGAVCPGKPSDEGVELCLLPGGCVVLPGKDVPSCNRSPAGRWASVVARATAALSTAGLGCPV